MQQETDTDINYSIWQYANPVRMVLNFWNHRELIGQLVQREVMSKYKGTYLGILWGFSTPLFMLCVYTFVFGIVLKSRWPSSHSDSIMEYALTLFCGLLLYTIFSETLMTSSTLIISNPNYVKKVVFPLEILPVVILGSALFHGLLSVIVLLLGFSIFLGVPPWTILFFPLILFSLALLSLGLAWLVASLGVFVRDIQHSLLILVQFLFFCSPVLYPTSAVPESFVWVIKLNPISAMVNSGRRTLLWGQMPDWAWWGTVTIISLVIFQFGYMFFMKSKRAFADVL